MTLYRRTLADLEISPIEHCYRQRGAEYRSKIDRGPVVTVAGLSVLRQSPKTAKGVLFITLEDETYYIQCVVMPDVQEQFSRLVRSPALIVRGRLQGVGGWRGIVVEDLWELEGVSGGYRGFASASGGRDRLVLVGGNDLTSEERGLPGKRH